MTRLFLLFSAVVALTLFSCSSNDLMLITQVSVLEHASCESGDAAMVKLEANGGAAPYVYTIWDVAENTMILSEKSEENTVIFSENDLLSIDYRFVLTDSDGNRIEKDFQIETQGRSVISSQLTMKNEVQTIFPENIEIQLAQINTDVVISTYTDHEGRYSFEDLPGGNYTLEVMLHEKYDDYLLSSANDNSRVRIERGTHITRPFLLACNDSFRADFIITN